MFVFDRFTERAMAYDSTVHLTPKIFEDLFGLLRGDEYGNGNGAALGASYAQLFQIANLAGLRRGEERSDWVETCQMLGITSRHAVLRMNRIDEGALDA